MLMHIKDKPVSAIQMGDMRVLRPLAKKRRDESDCTYPKMTAFHCMILLSHGAPLIPEGGSCVWWRGGLDREDFDCEGEWRLDGNKYLLELLEVTDEALTSWSGHGGRGRKDGGKAGGGRMVRGRKAAGEEE